MNAEKLIYDDAMDSQEVNYLLVNDYPNKLAMITSIRQLAASNQEENFFGHIFNILGKRGVKGPKAYLEEQKNKNWEKRVPDFEELEESLKEKINKIEKSVLLINKELRKRENSERVYELKCGIDEVLGRNPEVEQETIDGLIKNINKR